MGIMTDIKKGKADAPNRILLYGVEGIGKSTWAAGAPRPLFICAEDGLGAALTQAERLNVDDYGAVLRLVAELRTDAHPYQTLAIDTADWLEPLIHAYICKRDGHANVEAYGYGKGYGVALTELRALLANLDNLRAARGMQIIFLAHAKIKTFTNPTGENYDRYQTKTNEQFGGLLKEWADIVMFARYEVFVKKDNKQAVKGKGFGGERICHTQWNPGWDAKNRHGLPETLPLDYAAFAEAIAACAAGLEVPAGEAGRKIAEDIIELFVKAAWPAPDLEGKVLARLGGSVLQDDLIKLSMKKLEGARDYLLSIQPQPDLNPEPAPGPATESQETEIMHHDAA